MGLLIRTVLIWLLVLAVPAQAAAAATMAFCGPSHHGGTPTAHAHEGTGPAGPHHHGPAPTARTDGEGHSMHGPGQVDGSVSPLADAAALVDDVEQQKCSACASCCSSGAIVGTMATLAAPAGSPTLFDAVVHTVDPFAVGGPDRPPRIVLV